MAQQLCGSLIEAGERRECQYIAHQTNCTTATRAAGLALAIFERFPLANTYEAGLLRTLGTIDVVYADEGRCGVINMNAQQYPGAPRDDTVRRTRLEAFKQCLDEIPHIENITSVGFPYGIGCGLGGGRTEDYMRLIDEFAVRNPHLAVKVYKY
jgi:hypothetical protein